MTRSAPRPGAAVLFAATVVAALVSVPLSAGREPVFDTVLYPVNAVALGLAGLLVHARLPRHPIGFLLSALGAWAALTELAEGYGYHPAWPGAAFAEWTAVWGSALGATSLTVVLLLFPSGGLPGPRWRPALGAALAGITLSVIGLALSAAADPADPYETASTPLAVLLLTGQLLWLGSFLAAVASLVVRYRRADGVERLQLKWLAYVVGLLALAGSVAIFAFYDSLLVQLAIACVAPLVPVAICVALLRYRLYDVDVLIARTLVYVGLTVLLAGAYLGTAVTVGAVLGRGTASPWVTAAATLTAAALFLPARRRLQDVVDRRFRRARHDALARVDTFLADLRAGRADVAGLEPLLRDVLEAPDLTLRFVLPDAEPVPAPAGRRRREVRRAGTLLAEIEIPDDVAPGHLDDVLSRAGLAVEIGRLLAEVSRSRARIAAAGLAERRRLERDLHDGAQQRLVGVGLALRHVQHRLPDDDTSRLLDRVVDEVGAAIQDLRGLANGVRPSLLDEGLDVALQDLARRVPLPVQVTVDVGSLPPDVATTAWFVVSEALANVVKHARAGAVEVVAGREDGTLRLSIADDGVGGAVRLRGLTDRVGAQGGTLDLVSPAGAGTTVEVRLPCGS